MVQISRNLYKMNQMKGQLRNTPDSDVETRRNELVTQISEDRNRLSTLEEEDDWDLGSEEINDLKVKIQAAYEELEVVEEYMAERNYTVNERLERN